MASLTWPRAIWQHFAFVFFFFFARILFWWWEMVKKRKEKTSPWFKRVNYLGQFQLVRSRLSNNMCPKTEVSWLSQYIGWPVLSIYWFFFCDGTGTFQDANTSVEQEQVDVHNTELTAFSWPFLVFSCIFAIVLEASDCSCVQRAGLSLVWGQSPHFECKQDNRDLLLLLLDT